MLREILEGLNSNVFGFNIIVNVSVPGDAGWYDKKDLNSDIAKQLSKNLPKNFGAGHLQSNHYAWGYDTETMRNGREVLKLEYQWVLNPNKFSDFGGNIITDDQDRMAGIDRDDKKAIAEYSKLAKKRFKLSRDEKPEGAVIKFIVYPYVWDSSKEKGMQSRASNYNNSW